MVLLTKQSRIAALQFETERYIRSTHPVLYLPLYRLDGIPFTSKDAFAHSCTVTGALISQQGRIFDGTDDNIDCGYSSTLRGSAQMSLEAWVKVSSIAAANDKPIASQLQTAGDYYTLLRIRHTTGLINALVYQSDDVAKGGDFTGAVVINTWYHLALVADGSFARLYINGVPDATTYAYDGTLNTTNINNDPFYIGKYGGVFLPGTIGELRLYNRGLTHIEVQNNFIATRWRYR